MVFKVEIHDPNSGNNGTGDEIILNTQRSLPRDYFKFDIVRHPTGSEAKRSIGVLVLPQAERKSANRHPSLPSKRQGATA